MRLRYKEGEGSCCIVGFGELCFVVDDLAFQREGKMICPSFFSSPESILG